MKSPLVAEAAHLPPSQHLHAISSPAWELPLQEIGSRPGCDGQDPASFLIPQTSCTQLFLSLQQLGPLGSRLRWVRPREDNDRMTGP